MKRVILLSLISLFTFKAYSCYYDFEGLKYGCDQLGYPATVIECQLFPEGGAEPPYVGCLTHTIDPSKCAYGGWFNEMETIKRCPPGTNPPPSQGGGPPPTTPGNFCGSIVNSDSQVIIESIPVPGTSYSLSYASNKVIGYKEDYKKEIPVVGADFFPDPIYSGVKLEISIAGQYHVFNYIPVADLIQNFHWDGKDNLGNPVNGVVDALVRVTFELVSPLNEAIPTVYNIPFGSIVDKKVSFKGWDIDVRHVYDPDKKILYKGNGEFHQSDFFEKADGTKIILSSDRSEFYVFNSSFKHITTKDFITGKTKLTFGYNTSGQLTSISDAYSNQTTIQYTSGVVSSITSPFGQVTTIGTDSNDRIISVMNSLLEGHSMTYDSNDLLLTFLKPNGNLTTVSYDSQGRMISDVNSEGPEVNLDITVNSSNRLITNTSASGLISSIETITLPGYYKRTVQSPNYRMQEYIETTESVISKDNDVEVTSSSEPDLRFSSKFRSPASESTLFGGQIKTTVIAENATLLSSDPFDFSLFSRTKTVDLDVEEVQYSPATSLLMRTTPEGRTESVKLNSQGSIIEQQVGTLLKREFSYNSLGQMTSQKQGLREFLMTYSPSNGKVSKVTNPMLGETNYSYNVLGRPTSMTLPDLRVIGFSYDIDGNLTSITPAGRPIHNLTYTGLGYLESYLPPTIGLPSSSTTYTYNNDRKLSSVLRPNGELISYDYSIYSGDLNTITFPAGTRYFGFSAGNLSNSSSEDGVMNYYYYQNGFNYSHQLYTGTLNYNLYKTLNTKHQLASEDLYIGPHAINTIFAYDKDALLTQAGPLLITRDIDLGIIKKITSNNVEVGFTHSANYGELSGIKSIVNSTTDTYQTTYTRDLLGRISTLSEKYQSGPTANYEYIYDVTGRLVEVKVGSVTSETYGYDSNSNRNTQTISSTTTTATYDDQDRLLTFGSKAFTYNANGELQTQTDGSITKTFTYDVFGNLKSVVLPSKTINYHVDAHDRRIARLEGTTYTHHYIWNDKKIIGIADDSGTLLARFIYGSKEHVPDYMITDTAEYMIVSNHLGSPVQVIDVNSGVVIQEIKYNVWGEIISDTNPGFQPFGFAGCLYDQDTKLCRFGVRDYDPSIGRWLSKDPILFNGGDANLYGYVLQDPVNWIDITGENRIAIAGGAFIITYLFYKYFVDPNFVLIPNAFPKDPEPLPNPIPVGPQTPVDPLVNPPVPTSLPPFNPNGNGSNSCG